eukprot:CAMPEP_0116832796 /NCGR_PEP_ID=MMETSP0418-20121206/6089_1 /TAXON_ID=1158023 /ORGANISM="Astrosyne radiata, Strain 13vi08-1A" /LENGTH=507 /DNA_ID=CAMNT_0004462193 /DNA_START=45 /DNA_END=1568 /DNA_ORIENTATION=-
MQQGSWVAGSARRRQFSSRLGLGGHKWSQMDPSLYAAVVQAAVEKCGVTIVEAGQEGGEEALANLLRQNFKGGESQQLRVLARIGYHSIKQTGQNPEDQDSGNDIMTEGDVIVEEQPLEGGAKLSVVHNLGRQSVSNFIADSPFMSLPGVETIPVLHNPEVHNNMGRQERMMDAFCYLEEAVASQDDESKISGFGVVSNGLSLPPEHPLHLDWRNVLEVACRAAETVTGSHSHLSVLQLPANLLETRGVQVARDIHHHVRSSPFLSSDADYMPKNLEVYAMRPLVCYPDQGTGTGNGFELVDYRLPVSSLSLEGDQQETATTQHVLTHEMNDAPPPAYPRALNAALSHFDGTELLELRQQRELDAEERETLEGCKLLQSLLHDLDVGLAEARSFAAHEEHLVTQVIPTLYGTLEEMDEESSAVLQNFFAAHGMAIRHAIAKNTRALLKKGGEGVDAYDIPPEMSLQEYALQFLAKEAAIDKIIVGCKTPAEVVESATLADAVTIPQE